MKLACFPIQCFLLILLLGITEKAYSLDNFQERCIYYSNDDYGCGYSYDRIILNFNLSDEYVIRRK